MTFNKIASAISKLEGKKGQVSIGNIREVLSCLTILEANQVLKGGPAAKNPMKTLKKISNKKVIETKMIFKKNKKRNGSKKL